MNFWDLHNMQNFNSIVFTSINQGAGYYSFLDIIMLFATHYIPYVMIGLVLIYMLWWYPKEGLFERIHRLAQSIEFACALATTFILVQFIKVVIAYPRPFAVLPQTVLLIPDQAGYSFPSMHTALTVAAAMSIFVHHRRLGLLLLLLALLVGISRIYVGVHYPIDVVVGGLIGWGISVLLHALFSKIAHHTHKK
jgi:undecaprenyl-diphosphatase